MAELHDAVTRHHTTLFGVEGQGGLVNEVEEVKASVAAIEKKLAAVNLKWLVLMGLAGATGNSVGSYLIQTLRDLL